MRCPDCGANMPAEGICPECGHLVIEDAQENEADGFQVARPADGSKAKFDSAPVLSAPGAKDGQLARARDYTALLLGVAIYSLLLHPTLVHLTLYARDHSANTILTVAAIYVPISYLLTRLMCTIEPQSGRWRIRNGFLRRIFTKLNALWFGMG